LNASDTEYSDPGMPWQRWTWVMPNSTHGTLVEVARPYRAVEGKWVSGTLGE
jgi:methylmalonyl-CoA/ethylmalonyl-CoA epimerase